MVRYKFKLCSTKRAIYFYSKEEFDSFIDTIDLDKYKCWYAEIIRK